MIGEKKSVDVGNVWWFWFSTNAFAVDKRLRRIMRILPRDPRCKFCNAPFQGAGGVIVRLLFNKQRSALNPRFCNLCEIASREFPGGAEVEMAILFADIRGSTALSEQMSATEFSQLINRFYKMATHVLIQTDALVDRLLGDEAIGLYLPGFAGPEHPRKAVEAAQELLKLTGHNDAKGPWLPVGVGIHTGLAYVGVVGSEESTADFTALGDNVNITARLASQAGAGEILISDASYSAAGLDLQGLEYRHLELKGKSEPIGVHVLRVAQGEARA